MRPTFLFTAAITSASCQFAHAGGLPHVWSCEGGITASISEADHSIAIRFASGKLRKLPLVTDIAGNRTWNVRGVPLCDNVKDLCAFSALNDDRALLFISVDAEQEPLSCNAPD